MIVLIDNYDSFTFNLYQYLSEFEQVKVYRNDEITLKEIKYISKIFLLYNSFITFILLY